jgi:hypothetical protein
MSVPLAAAFLFLLAASLRRPSSGLAVGAGGSLALASLVWTPALAMLPLTSAALFDRRYPARIRLSLAGSTLFGFLFCFGSGMLFRHGGIW